MHSEAVFFVNGPPAYRRREQHLGKGNAERSNQYGSSTRSALGTHDWIGWRQRKDNALFATMEFTLPQNVPQAASVEERHVAVQAHVYEVYEVARHAIDGIREGILS